MNPNKNYADPIKITFYFLPFSLVLGSLILNINIALLLIFCTYSLFTTSIKNTIKSCLVIIAKGLHPIPFRTRK